MNCGLVCAKLLWLGCVSGISFVTLHFLHNTDEDFEKTRTNEVLRFWLIYSITTGVALGHCLEENLCKEWIIYGVLAVYLIISGVTDSAIQMVYDFIQYIGLFGGCLVLLYCNLQPQSLGALLLFAGIQRFVFAKMYGPADVGAFLICAMYLAAEGGTILDFLMHMMLTFLFLGIVQGCKRNISLKGNLKHPVALFPYILVAFFLII